MRSWADLRALPRRIGRRGAYLAGHGVLALAYGYALSIAATLPAERMEVYTLIVEVMPLIAWAWTWAAIGVLSVIAALIKPLDRFAFAGQMVVSMLWTLGFGLVEFVNDTVPPRTWVVGLLFAALASGHAVVAGWPERREAR